MSEASRNRFFQKTILAAWAFITLVLAVVILLMVNERAEQKRTTTGTASAGAGTPATPAANSAPVRSSENERVVRLYFATPDGAALAAEDRAIGFHESTIDNCRAALEAVLGGPRESLSPVAPATASIRGVYALDGGRLLVDLSREVAQGLPRSAAAEALFTQSLAHTLTQTTLQTPDGIRVLSVRVLIEGFPAVNSFASHLDLSDFITPDPEWLQAAPPAA